jgi:hypothetical protein
MRLHLAVEKRLLLLDQTAKIQHDSLSRAYGLSKPGAQHADGSCSLVPSNLCISIVMSIMFETRYSERMRVIVRQGEPANCRKRHEPSPQCHPRGSSRKSSTLRQSPTRNLRAVVHTKSRESVIGNTTSIPTTKSRNRHSLHNHINHTHAALSVCQAYYKPRTSLRNLVSRSCILHLVQKLRI